MKPTLVDAIRRITNFAVAHGYDEPENGCYDAVAEVHEWLATSPAARTAQPEDTQRAQRANKEQSS